MRDMRLRTCDGCYFWQRQGDQASGICRRHAPIVMDRAWTHPEFGLQGETATQWPDTKADDFCGDWSDAR